jgi:hypothetical protein
MHIPSVATQGFTIKSIMLSVIMLNVVAPVKLLRFENTTAYFDLTKNYGTPL